MSEVILHVGTHKTGSTSIQKTLNEYSVSLEESGIISPKNSRYLDFYRAFTDHPESFHHYYRNWDNKAKSDKCRNVIKKTLTKGKDATYIFSSEDISLLSEDALSRLNDFLLDDCGCSKVRVICYMRNPLDYLNSSIQEFVKQGLLSLKDITENNFDSYRLQGHPGFSGGKEDVLKKIYLNIPGKLIRSFGADSVSFVKFENAIEAGLTSTLLSHTTQKNNLPRIEEKRENISISHEASILIAQLNNKLPTLTDTLKINRCRLAYKPYIRFLMSLPGKKPLLLDASDINLESINSEIDAINSMIGTDILSPIDRVPAKYGCLSLEISDVTRDAIYRNFDVTDRIEKLFDKKDSIDKLAELNRLLGMKYSKRLPQSLLHRIFRCQL